MIIAISIDLCYIIKEELLLFFFSRFCHFCFEQWTYTYVRTYVCVSVFVCECFIFRIIKKGRQNSQNHKKTRYMLHPGLSRNSNVSTFFSFFFLFLIMHSLFQIFLNTVNHVLLLRAHLWQCYIFFPCSSCAFTAFASGGDGNHREKRIGKNRD